jgi:transposase
MAIELEHFLCLARDGRTKAELAEVAGLSERSVYRLLRRLKACDRNLKTPGPGRPRKIPAVVSSPLVENR